ncbi:mechanosensitive ion channel family protein [Qipengyuania citrea]|uniref:Mechanosensitive ion channel family protein n=1 Tax=Qipengyuania citrea TaxID=225971 RepID=A0ABY4U9F7_9SPHN|nr:mechanosensitive ion channel family protein [Qipengyuania citrea]USA60665.1 mechanosensitive ion channel family protein [Qipengyuania citrea]
MKNLRQVLVILCALFGFSTSSALLAAASAIPVPPSASESAAVQQDPFGRDTPRSAVTGLLRALGSNDPAMAEPFLDAPQGGSDDVGELAARLQGALDMGGSLATFQELSTAPEGRLDDGLAPEFERVGFLPGGETPILLERQATTEGPSAWKISSQTLEALPEQLAEADGPVQDSATIAGAPLSDWAIILGLLLLAILAARLVSALVLLLLRQVMSADNGPYRLIHAALPPLGLLVAIVTFRTWSDGAAISIVARQLVLRYLGIAGLIAVVWLGLRLVDALARWLSGRMERKERHQSASVIVFVRRLVKSALLVIVTLGILDTLGVNVTAGVAALGIGGLVLALGAQKTVENLVGTVSVLADRPIQVGDFCKVGDVMGTVEDIGMRSTRIRTLERTVITIPNGDFSSRQIENYTKRDRYLFNEVIGLEYALSAARLRQAISIIETALKENEFIADDPLRTNLRYFGADSLAIETYAYIDVADFTESLTIRSDLLLDIFTRLEEAEIGIAFPTRTVYLRSEAADQS